MEDVYIIKVKTKPALATLYPSERRYSASTVGGLSFVHVTFGSLGLLLAVVGNSVQGIVLFVCCLAPLTSGILAWKRWYIDRNINIFFYCSIFSAAVSVCCFVAAVYDLSVLTERVFEIDKLANKDDFYNDTMDMDNTNVDFISTTSIDNSTSFDTEDFTTRSDYDDDPKVVEDTDNDDVVRSRILLMVNVTVACLLEFIWSLLSIRIALKGMKKEFWTESQSRNKDKDKKIQVTTVSALSSRPDIILMNKHICCSMQSLDSLQSLSVQSMCPKLPLPESSREYKERVDKFLTNQVHHQKISEST